MNNDHLDEPLKRFLSFHRLANCARRPIEGFDEKRLKVESSQWVDCGLEKGITFEGQQLLAAVDPRRPFGLLASFYRNRLAELTYTLAITSIDAFLPFLERCYGPANRVAYGKSGKVGSVTWIDRGAKMDVELVAISPAVVDQGFLRIGAGESGTAVQIRIRANHVPTRSP